MPAHASDDMVLIGAGIYHPVGDRSCPCCYGEPEDCDFTTGCTGLKHFYCLQTKDGDDVVKARCDTCRKRGL